MKAALLSLTLFMMITAAFASEPAERRGRIVENRGQMNEEVDFYLCGKNKTFYFTSEGITLALNNGASSGRWVIKMVFMGVDRPVKPRAFSRHEALLGFFKGKDEDGITRVPAYGRIVYTNLWPGIDLIYTLEGNRIKYRFLLRPEADAAQIRLKYLGATGVILNEAGGIEIETPAGSILDGRPFTYQVIDGTRREVCSSYLLEEMREEGAFLLGFHLEDRDPSAPLVIDPEMLLYCGYLGGQHDEKGYGIAVDGEGSVYVTGMTHSPAPEFPAKAGPDLTYNGDCDAFVAKVNPAGTSLLYCGYIGGSDWDCGFGVSVDGQGNAFITGETYSSESSFPVKGGPDLSHNGKCDAFVAGVNASGTELLFCGYIGGAENDYGTRIAPDKYGNVYVTGGTFSPASTFPVHLGPGLVHQGEEDAFAAKVIPGGAGLAYCGYIGGEKSEKGVGIAVNADGNAFLSGWTSSSEKEGFPVTTGPDLTYNGGWEDAFVARLSPDGRDLEYCGYIGGSERENGAGMALDAQGCAYVTGSTRSPETTFPVLKGPDLTHNGGEDAFVAKVDPKGTGLVYCGYIGGSKNDKGWDIVLDGLNRACITGLTSSGPADGFPCIAGPGAQHQGKEDAFAARVDDDGSALCYCGYIGGAEDDHGHDIAVDHRGGVYVTGFTRSTALDGFPVLKGPDVSHNGLADVFLARITTLALTADAEVLSESQGGAIRFALNAGDKDRGYILLGSVSGTSPGTSLPGGKAVLPLNWDAFTNLVITQINTPHFSDFSGNLDSSGKGAALFDTLGPLPPGFLGTVIHFAALLDGPWDAPSNSAAVEIIP